MEENGANGFVVGGKATVMRRQLRGEPAPESVGTVTRVTKSFIELENGSRWSTDDRRRYPKNQRSQFGGATASFIEPGGTEDIEKRVAAKRARESIMVRGTSSSFADCSPKNLSDAAALRIIEIWDADIDARKEEVE